MTFLDPDLSGPWAAVLEDRSKNASSADLLRMMIEEVFPGRIALVSSFGAESAILLHMISGIDRHLPVLFVDSGKLFGETLRYRDRLVETLRLTAVQSIAPLAEKIAGNDADGMLFNRNPDACCYWRKVEPLERALKPYKAWISGRKRYHGGARAGLQRIDAIDRRIRISPLADWSRADIDAYFAAHALPRHPLEADGFLSIGCMPCTERVAPDSSDIRSGRWSGRDKTECGIHLPLSEARRRAAVA